MNYAFNQYYKFSQIIYLCRYVLLTVMLYFSVMQTSLAQETSESLYTTLTNQLSKAQSLRCEATSEDNSALKLRIISKRGNSFVIDMGERTVICNGKDLWNINKKEKSVTVSTFKSQANSLSLEKVFFDVIGKYKPTSLTSANNSTNGSSYQLRLEPPKGEKIMDVSSITLNISKKTKAIQRVSIALGQATQNWLIRSLVFNPPLTAKVFTYTPPKGVEIVDMR
jgi:outer membrane lipoprotein-sorting protein